MTDFIEDPLLELEKKLADDLYDLLKSAYGYAFKSHTFIKTLTEDSNKLQDEYDRVLNLLNIATSNGEIIVLKVRDWERNTEVKKKGAVDLITQSSDHHDHKISCSDAHCGWCLSFNEAKQADTLSKAMKKLVEEGSQFKRDNISINPIKEPLPNTLVEGYKAIPSRERLLEEIKEALVGDQMFVIGVYGSDGVGKTSLINKLAFDMDRSEEPKPFRGVALLSGENLKEKSLLYIQAVIAESLGFDVTGFTTVEGRASKVNAMLSRSDSKVLIIIDDVPPNVDLKQIGVPFHNDGCRILVVSSNLDECKAMNTQKNFEVKPLPEAENSTTISSGIQQTAASNKMLGTSTIMVDANSHTNNTIMLDADSLHIESADNPQRWRVFRNPTTNRMEAELIQVWSLSIKGKASESQGLKPATNYGAYFVYKLLAGAKGFTDNKVDLKVDDNSKACYLDPSTAASNSQADSDLPKTRDGEWLEIEMGRFIKPGPSDLTVNLVVQHITENDVKTGLRVQGIELRQLDQN